MTTSNSGSRPTIAELGHVGIRCKDVARQVEFYTTVLNLTVTDHDEELDTWFLSARPGQEHHELLLTGGRNVAENARLIQQISFRCNSLDDVIGFYRILKASGTQMDAIVSHGNAVGVYFFDPEGNRCEVYWQTGLTATQPFVDYIDIEGDPGELLESIRRSVDAFGATGFRAGRYVEWAKKQGGLQ